jgi:hypothetical protein
MRLFYSIDKAFPGWLRGLMERSTFHSSPLPLLAIPLVDLRKELHNTGHRPVSDNNNPSDFHFRFYSISLILKF